ncbi:hypothetical protein GCM10011591_04410 [Nocardia camponoti]|uniref:SDR family NAD(P)-dependent oxidoreductase n=1 Tax=Nocardia camponoti TaxID=1616106 RepID=A0A917Q996_9NOCA|nr:hypothetical protein GCM10011591_04410 [Nocardia camponoti]
MLGRDRRKRDKLMQAASALGAGGRLRFIATDLSSMTSISSAIDRIRDDVPRIDALVFCARHYRSERLVTPDGFEYTFALFYLSRFILGYALLDRLAAASRPVIVNVAGPGTGTGQIHWDDLGLANDYHGLTALSQGGQLNDLLGLEFARRFGGTGVRYVLVHPGIVDSGLSGDYDPQMTAHIAAMRITAQPVEHAVLPILDVIASPPDEPLTAIARGRRLDLTEFNGIHGPRLFNMTTKLLGHTVFADRDWYRRVSPA